MLRLNTIKAQPGANKNKKRLGRGPGSGHGMTSGKGDKGQLARSGGKVRAGFEGGQTPLYRRLPKFGFKNVNRKDFAIINLAQLYNFEGKVVDLPELVKAKLVKGRYDFLAVLGTGEIKKALTVKAHRVSESAKAKIEKAGGKVEMIEIVEPKGKKVKKQSKK